MRRTRARRTRRTRPTSDKSLINRGPLWMPDQYVTKLKFFLNDGTTAPGGTPLSVRWAANSARPAGSGGNLPAGFSQLGAMYARYLVYGAKIKIRMAAITDVAATSTYDYCLIPTNLLGTPANNLSPQQISTYPYARYRVSGSDATMPQTISMYMTTAKTNGVKRLAVKSDIIYTGTTASGGGIADPAQLWYFYFTFAAFNGTSAISLDYHVEITQYISFQERVQNPS